MVVYRHPHWQAVFAAVELGWAAMPHSVCEETVVYEDATGDNGAYKNAAQPWSTISLALRERKRAIILSHFYTLCNQSYNEGTH